jgi:hypothetical protein
VTVINYNAPPVVSAFLRCNALVTLIIGPFGSGKSTGCVMRALMRAQQQAPSKNGKRRTKFVVVRNTYRELMDTTKPTIEAWIPSDIRTWVVGDATFHIRYNDVECELLLRALDTPEDVKKLLSLDITGAWVNEAKQIPKAILDGLTGRIGRYPNSETDGFCSWRGIWMDTNPPDADHWLYKTFEEFENIEMDDRGDYRVFHQPSGLASNAENVENLLKGARKPDGRPLYYAQMMVGKTKEWINVFVHGRYGFLAEGLPVFPEYQDEIHTAKAPLPWRPGLTLLLGMDFGLTPALVVAQRISGLDQLQIIDEIVSTNMGALRFAKHAKQYLVKTYPGAHYIGWGDPAGEARSQADEQTPFDVVQANGLPIDPAPTNDVTRRREAVADGLTTLTMNGTPALLISPKCKVLRKGMNGGYHRARVQVSGGDRYRDEPVKNEYSHVCDALQYIAVGLGMDSKALDTAAGVDDSGPRRPSKVKTAISRSNHGPR